MSYAITSPQSLPELTTPDDDDVIPISEVSVTPRATDGVIASGSLGRLTSVSAPFLASDSGKFVTIPGAGASGVDHVAQVRFISATTVAITPSALTAVASADFFFAVTKKVKISTLRQEFTAESGWHYFTFAWNTASPVSLLTVPANKKVLTSLVTVGTAFNGSSPSITIGTSASPASVLAADMTLLSEAGSYETYPETSWGSATALRLTINPGSGASAGAGSLALHIEE